MKTTTQMFLEMWPLCACFCVAVALTIFMFVFGNKYAERKQRIPFFIVPPIMLGFIAILIGGMNLSFRYELQKFLFEEEGYTFTITDIAEQQKESVFKFTRNDEREMGVCLKKDTKLEIFFMKKGKGSTFSQVDLAGIL